MVEAVDIKEYFESLMEERQLRLDERFDAVAKALELQAQEYSRRLHDLNGEYQRDRARQSNYVTTDKFEDTQRAETTARAAALLRVDEKFEEYVKRYEQRQREVDLLLAAQDGATREAQRIAEEEGRKAREQTDSQARKTNRNLAIVGLGLTALVMLVNLLPTILP